MKKFMLAFAALSVVALIIYGRDLIALYHLVNAVETTTEAYEERLGTWPQVVDGCDGCHGVLGSSEHQRYPSLAGQPAEYLALQLERFASGERRNPNMGPQAKILSAAEIESVSTYYAAQPARENRWVTVDPERNEQGRKLVSESGCAACHGSELMGQGVFPRLAGQGEDYLLVQLDAFAEGRRQDPTGAMQAITSGFSSEQRRAISHYLATLPVPSR